MFDKKLTLKSSLVLFILQSLIQDVPPAQLVVEDGLDDTIHESPAKRSRTNDHPKVIIDTFKARSSDL